ncbi:4Fe-4S binding protein [Bacillaceae bacterium S4-13-58]
MEKRVVFQEDLCKSCSLCVQVCPKDIIFLSNRLNAKGYRPATVEDQESCISCMKCAQICPDTVITVYRPARNKVS